MNFDIAIIGGGLVGASLAASLKNSGLSLALVENQPAPTLNEKWDSRIYAISPGSRHFLEQSGAWPVEASRIAPVEAMRVFGDACPEPGRRGGAKLEFSAYQMGVPELACILESRVLQHALWQALQTQDNLTLLHPARCSSLRFGTDAATLVLEDGRTFDTLLAQPAVCGRRCDAATPAPTGSAAPCRGRTMTAKLVVGADGRDSWVRNQAGVSAAPVDYRQHGVVANFSCELPHRGIAHQWFQPDGILALLPLPGKRVSMVWSVSPEKSAQLLALTHAELGAHVADAARHTLGMLGVITPPAAFPLRLLVLPHISAPRLALIGDAAHNMHPLAGQGVNTGFRDARQLSQLLLDRGAQTDCGDAQLLRQYERKRKEDIYSMQATTYGLKNLFCNDDPLLRMLRNTGLGAVNRLAPLKKMLMQHALN
jgi:ubiquinone biosynthesis UbiH/UbiF/VisC/COQ6 family hydroxylase